MLFLQGIPYNIHVALQQIIPQDLSKEEGEEEEGEDEEGED